MVTFWVVINIYDIQPALVRETIEKFPKVKLCEDILSCVKNSVTLITCTTSKKPFILRSLIKTDSLHIHVGGGNEYELEVFKQFRRIVVDDWEELSVRSNNILYEIFKKGIVGTTQLEYLHNLKENDWSTDTSVFCPAGLSSVDLVIAGRLYQEFLKKGFSLKLW